MSDRLTFHEYADIFPMLPLEELDTLAADIAANGLLEPITLYEGKVLDGRNRYVACLNVAVDPRLTQYTGDDPLGFVLSKNLHRRQLTSSQRAVVALEVERHIGANLEAVRREKISQYRQTGETTQIVESSQPAAEQAARMVGTNRQYVSDAKKIAAQAPELIPQIASGAMTIPEAKREIRRAERVEAIVEATGNNQALDGIGKFAVVYADPPWEYDYSVSDNRQIENQYPTMPIEDICALPVADIANDDAVLLLWATNPKLIEALQVIEAWGFSYRTNMVWVKDKIGMGYYARQQHELLLIATRGALPVPEPANRPSSVIQGDRTEHSKKPDAAYEIIERMYPEYAKVELFSRNQREGWVAWGNQL